MESLDGQYMTSQEVARILGIHPRAVANMAAAGRLPGAERVAYRWLVRRDALSEFAKTYDGRKGPQRKKPENIRRRKA